jgi:cysteine desulfurase family protein
VIYFDNAATTYPKPPEVRRAIAEAMVLYGANPGRGGHALSLRTAEQVYACREAVSSFFKLDNPANVVFTANCTISLNLVIKGTVQRGDHVVISDLEHNSVLRPLETLKEQGVTYTEAVVHPYNPQKTIESFCSAIRSNTKLILCSHASNVLGYRAPIEQLARLASKRGIPFAVDAAQSGGILPIDMSKTAIDYLCLPGHKGLYGPMGTGLLLCRGSHRLTTLIEGGSGSQSLLPQQPDELPEHLESGTLNVPGICGLLAGIQWLDRHGIERIAFHENSLMRELYSRLTQISNIHLYTEFPSLSVCVPLLTFNIDGQNSEAVAEYLNCAGIAVRAGLHCAPSAHRRMQTTQMGAVRLCPSAFTTNNDIDYIYKKIIEIARNS